MFTGGSIDLVCGSIAFFHGHVDTNYMRIKVSAVQLAAFQGTLFVLGKMYCYYEAPYTQVSEHCT